MCSEMPCAICSIHACAAPDKSLNKKIREGSMSVISTAWRLAAGSAAILLSLAMPASAQSEPKPQYGGMLEIGTVYVTLSALSFDPADWNWKLNHDTGNYLEQLFAADLSKSVRKGGKHRFYADAYLPSDAIRGELAESWEWKESPLRIEIKLRKRIMFPEKQGVMT